MLDYEKRIDNKAKLNEFLTYEHTKYGNVNGIKYFFQLGESAKLWRHQLLLRKTEYYSNTNKKIRALLYRIMLNSFQDKYSIHIPLNTCGKGLKLMHVGPVIMNWDATVGENCVFHLNTGVVAGGTSDSAPQLGDNIVVGIGAIILGGIRIADGVAIGANAVVNKDVLEPNITVAGVPARKISDHGRNEWARNKVNTY